VNGKVVDGQGGYSVSSQRTVGLLGTRWLGRICGPGESSAFKAKAIHCRPAMIMWIEEPYSHSPSPPAPIPLGERGERVHSGDERLKRRASRQAIA
jgi:hypothetical protein